MPTGVSKTRRMKFDEVEMRKNEGPVNEIEVPVKACENNRKTGDAREKFSRENSKKAKIKRFSQ